MSIAISKQDAGRLAKAVKRVERKPLNMPGGRRVSVTPMLKFHIGVTNEAIDIDSNGYVTEWLPDDYGAETESDAIWRCRSWIGNVEENVRVFFVTIGAVAYIVNAACEERASG